MNEVGVLYQWQDIVISPSNCVSLPEWKHYLDWIRTCYTQKQILLWHAVEYFSPLLLGLLGFPLGRGSLLQLIFWQHYSKTFIMYFFSVSNLLRMQVSMFLLEEGTQAFWEIRLCGDLFVFMNDWGLLSTSLSGIALFSWSTTQLSPPLTSRESLFENMV